ncbi:MAG TPA: glycoside hydrolase family 13 protein [Dinghuibacter sp.]|uniref:glycoside hydrolase family 13 protein n=1 Tax=Dinghuibacter sp. TaxID=2024697 RepID=UPI002C202928|nr:glycoside hydrolase family 13 protein [Dinghuibacter sp.]HTJ13793.1 glycoside hydrolase family 13 protein [Dinghuibacter sp.]
MRLINFRAVRAYALPACALVALTIRAAAQNQVITLNPGPRAPEVKVNPLNWWVGMKDRDVQLMLYAPGIGKTKPQLTAYTGVAIKATHTVENPNYLFVDLDIAPAAKPGVLHFQLAHGGALGARSYTLDYTLKALDPADGVSRIQGVTNKDFVYLLMPDRFANGDPANDVVPGMRDTVVRSDKPNERHGGDLKGVEDHLGYLKDLGITTVWMTPVNENDMPSGSYHGYAITDQYQVDRRFGGNEAYASLSKALHQKNMKLIQDGVYNHIGSSHWTVLDPPMKDWLNQWPQYTNTSYKVEPLVDPYASAIDRRKTVEGWFVKSMPDLNQRNPYVSRYLIEYALWTTETYGVDGWRVDTWFYSDRAFLNDINAALVRQFPRITMFGEVWVGTVAEAAYFCQNNLDVPYKPNLQGVVDFNVCWGMQNALRHDGNPEQLYSTLAQDFLYKNPTRNCIMLDNHDMDRFPSIVDTNLDRYKMGFAWLLTLRGIPEMYYGDELMMTGLKKDGDGALRKDFPGGWPGDDTNKFVAAGRTPQEQEAFSYVRTLAQYRRHSTALTTGKLMQYAPVEGVYVYFRYDAQQTVMVVANTGDHEQTLDTQRYAERTAGFSAGRDVLTASDKPLAGLTIGAHQTLVMELKR